MHNSPRDKIILGAIALSVLEGEREAILAMLLPRTIERDGRFVSEHLSGEQSGDAAPSDLN